MTDDSQDRPQRNKKSKPFPWRCVECGKKEVVPAKIPYTAEVKHDGTLHAIEIPELEIPICATCGEEVFTNDVDDQISEALRIHLQSSAPEQNCAIRESSLINAVALGLWRMILLCCLALPWLGFWVWNSWGCLAGVILSHALYVCLLAPRGSICLGLAWIYVFFNAVVAVAVAIVAWLF
ncbi:MAG: hypothetical protein HQ567_07030 [Candidatus Nealsonbacteria bacterium]|nr:hypothetical protein [Candidatus Nealsonbacteria bacterium]